LSPNRRCVPGLNCAPGIVPAPAISHRWSLVSGARANRHWCSLASVSRFGFLSLSLFSTGTILDPRQSVVNRVWHAISKQWQYLTNPHTHHVRVIWHNPHGNKDMQHDNEWYRKHNASPGHAMRPIAELGAGSGQRLGQRGIRASPGTLGKQGYQGSSGNQGSSRGRGSSKGRGSASPHRPRHTS
jgi:hypothetical protein